MKKNILYPFLLSLFIFSACNPESFEQVVEFDVPDEKSRLSVNCEYLNNSDSIQVFVSQSWNTDKNPGNVAVSNAQVSLWDGSQKIVDIHYRLTQKGYSNGNFQTNMVGYYSIKVPKSLEAGRIYTLKANAPNFDEVAANTVMPKRIEINKSTYIKKGFKPRPSGGFGGGLSNLKDLINLEFNDVQGENNYYFLQVRKVLRDSASKKLYYSSTPFFINQTLSAAGGFEGDNDQVWSGALTFTDVTFDGKAFVLRIGLDNDGAGGGFFGSVTNENGSLVKEQIDFNKLLTESYDIRLYSRSKEHYFFQNSLSTYYANEGNPFGEPVPLYTNFDKGFGIFTLTEVSKVMVKKK